MGGGGGGPNVLRKGRNQRKLHGGGVGQMEIPSMAKIALLALGRIFFTAPAPFRSSDGSGSQSALQTAKRKLLVTSIIVRRWASLLVTAEVKSLMPGRLRCISGLIR